MPQDPFDDPFADLFGKLPDPRFGDDRRRAEREEPSAAPTVPPRAEAAGADGAPLTRRQMREAAARQVPAPADAPISDVPRAAASASEPTDADFHAAVRPATPRGESAFGRDADLWATPRSAPAAAGPQPGEDDPATHPLFGADLTGTAPAMPYSRTGNTDPTPTVTGPEQAPARTATATALREPSLDDLFSGNGHTDDLGEVPPKPDRRKRRIGGWIALGALTRSVSFAYEVDIPLV